MSLPPAARPPGRKLVGAAKAEVDFVRRVQGTMCAGVLAKQAEKPKKPRSVEHLGDFRDGNGVHRTSGGQFQKETTPPHKRIKPRLPPFTGPWSEERKNRARITREKKKRREP